MTARCPRASFFFFFLTRTTRVQFKFPLRRDSRRCVRETRLPAVFAVEARLLYAKWGYLRFRVDFGVSACRADQLTRCWCGSTRTQFVKWEPSEGGGTGWQHSPVPLRFVWKEWLCQNTGIESPNTDSWSQNNEKRSQNNDFVSPNIDLLSQNCDKSSFWNAMSLFWSDKYMFLDTK